MGSVYQFGPYRQDADARSLTREGTPVSITPKAFDTLLYLVSHAGQTVSREELMRAVWPDAFVEEGNLNFNISQIRKLLGEPAPGLPYIQTLPKQGYRFVAEVIQVEEEVKEPARPPKGATAPARRLATWMAAAAIVVALLSGGLGLMKKADMPSPKVIPFTSSGTATYPSFSPDGNLLAFSWGGPNRDKWGIYVQQIGAGSPLRLTQGGSDRSPVFSPDGRYIASPVTPVS
jgi:DNA-binding winged helix-turn-helix (wHTH) protein